MKKAQSSQSSSAAIEDDEYDPDSAFEPDSPPTKAQRIEFKKKEQKDIDATRDSLSVTPRSLISEGLAQMKTTPPPRLSSATIQDDELDPDSRQNTQTTKVQRDEFGQQGQQNTQATRLRPQNFPPPSNSAYLLTSDGHHPEVLKRLKQRYALEAENHNLLPVFRNLSIDMPQLPSATICPLSSAPQVMGRDESVDSGSATSSQNPPSATASRPSTATSATTPDSAAKSTSSPPPYTKTLGEVLAEPIDWNYPLYDEGPGWEPGFDATRRLNDVEGPLEQNDANRKTFIRRVNQEVTCLSLCIKCNYRHIVDGPPVALPFTDRCGSKLPDWVTAGKEIDGAWEWFQDCINDLVRIDEIKKGHHYLRDPDRPHKWDKMWHDADLEWTVYGRRSGWWRCRKEGEGENVLPPEKTCKICHREPPEGAKKKQHVLTLDEQKKDIEDMMKRYMRVAMERDKAFVMKRQAQMDLAHVAKKLKDEQLRRDFEALE